MCGRYSIVSDLFQLQTFFSIDEIEPYPSTPVRPEWQGRWNGAPTQIFPVIVAEGNEGRARKVLKWMRWGLIPAWVKDDEAMSIGSRMINARFESVAEKPSFKRAVAHRRCLVPMNSFFEWHTDAQGEKFPYRIFSKEDPFLAVAGIWEEWKRHGKDEKLPEHLTTFSLLTQDANPFVSQIHHRMPILLDSKHQMNWLNPSVQNGTTAVSELEVFRYRTPELAADRVSRLVNSPKNDRPEIWKPAD
jgi:putative SOS response-associated peptidase YedK